MTYTQLSNPVRFAVFLASLLLVSCWHPVQALSSDKDQPIQIDSDAWVLDDQSNVTVFTGNVVVTRGSIRMTGDKMTIYYTEDDEIDTLIMEGNPATYRQLPDSSETYDQGRAMRMEYHEFENRIILIDNAEVTQERTRFSGDRIEYDTELSRIQTTSKPDEEDRIKIIINPRQQQGE